MDEDLKKDLKKIADEAEKRVAKSLLRWKYKKEGRPMPDNREMDTQSTHTAQQAHKIITKRGKKIWQEMKKAYQRKDREDKED